MKKRKKDRQRRKAVDRAWAERMGKKGKVKDERLSMEKALERGVVKGRMREKREMSGEAAGRGGGTTRVRNRCVETGNGRSVMGWFRKSGRQVRERARKGKLEGVYRASW